MVKKGCERHYKTANKLQNIIGHLNVKILVMGISRFSIMLSNIYLILYRKSDTKPCLKPVLHVIHTVVCEFMASRPNLCYMSGKGQPSLVIKNMYLCILLLMLVPHTYYACFRANVSKCFRAPIKMVSLVKMCCLYISILLSLIHI